MAAETSSLRPIMDWKNEFDKIDKTFNEYRRSNTLEIDEVNRYLFARDDAQFPGNFLVSGNCSLNEADVYCIGNDKLQQPFDMTGEAVRRFGENGKPLYCQHERDRMVRAIIYLFNNLLQIINSRGKTVKVFIPTVHYVPEMEKYESIFHSNTLTSYQIRNIARDNFKIEKALDEGPPNPKVSRLSDPIFADMQFRQLEEHRVVVEEQICIFIVHPSLKRKITHLYSSAKIVTFNSYQFNYQTNLPDRPSVPPVINISKIERLEQEKKEKGCLPLDLDREFTRGICLTHWPKEVVRPTNEAAFLNHFIITTNASMVESRVFQLTITNLLNLTQLTYSSLFVANLTTLAKSVVIILPKRYHVRGKDHFSLADLFFAYTGTHILGSGTLTLYQWKKAVRNLETVVKLCVSQVTPNLVFVVVGNSKDFTHACVSSIKSQKFQHYSWVNVA